MAGERWRENMEGEQWRDSGGGNAKGVEGGLSAWDSGGGNAKKLAKMGFTGTTVKKYMEFKMVNIIKLCV